MTQTQDRLYQLLPAIYRQRDAERGEPLRALLGIVEEQLLALEGDVDGLYRNWFVETCEPWVVPYLGDLVGVRGVQDVDAAGFSLRSYVANTIRYRRRKGTVGVVEDLARDVTGWPARAVEFFQRLDVTQHLDHVRADHHRTFDLRDAGAMELLRGPFGAEARTLEVRRIASHAGRYNVPNVGLFLWRLLAWRLEGVTARRVPGSSDPRVLWYRFEPHALDLDAPLFNRPETETDVAHLAEEIHVAGPLRARELARVVRASDDPEADDVPWFGRDPVVQVALDGEAVPVGALVFFERWEREDPADDAAVNDWPSIAPGKGRVAVDPARGRLVVHLADGEDPPDEVTVTFHAGFPGEVGAGPYDRSDLLDAFAEDDPDVPGQQRRREPDLQIGVSRAIGPVTDVVPTLAEAVAAWNAHAADRWADGEQASFGVICLMDARTYEESVSIVLKPRSELWIVAADWPEEPDPDAGGALARLKGSLSPTERRPHVRGSVTVLGEAVADEPATRPRIRLDGVQLEGDLLVAAGDLGELRFDHGTLVPQAGGLAIASPGADTLTTGNVGLELSFEASILGDVSGPETIAQLTAARCVVGAVALPGAAATFDGSTVDGAVSCRTIEASNSLFLGQVHARRRQEGCVRFSYVPEGSRVPRRFRCQPELALSEAPADQADHLRVVVQPTFTSRTWGHPAFFQLAADCAPQIREGADDGGEMGVWHHLQHPKREANLRAALEQYLRGGLEAGFFYVT